LIFISVQKPKLAAFGNWHWHLQKKLKKLKKYQVLNTESYGTNKRLKNIAKILIFKIFLILELCWKTQ